MPPLPEIFVGKEVINQRVRNFLQSKHPILSQALSEAGAPREETRSIWYSRDHIATWVDEMDLMEADGMRVYLGAYGEEEAPAPGQLCLLMVLTRAASDGNVHADIILEDETGYDQRQQTARKRSMENGLTQGGLTGGDLFAGAGLPREYNYGSPCPPVCNGQGPAFPQ